MINRVVLVGRPTRDIELKNLKSGTSLCSFTLAVERRFKNKNGEREADFISCIAWRKTAEAICNYTHKGSLIGVDGRIQTRNYDNKDGQRVYVTEVVADSFSFLESKKDKQNNQQGYNNRYQSNNNSKPANTTNKSKSKDPFEGSGDTLDITDDDLPF